MDYSTFQYIKVEKIGKVAKVTINRPELKNAINWEVHGEIERLWREIPHDDDVAAIVLTGAGDSFSAGGDIQRMAKRAGNEEGLKFSLGVPGGTRRLLQAMLDVDQPIIAAINGDCIGVGASISLMSDITVISETAKFGDPHVRIGLVAGDGGAVIWPLLIGPARAKNFLLRGLLMKGKEAADMGLITYAEPAGKVVDRAMEIAAEIAELPIWAVRFTKVAVNKAIKQQLTNVLETSIALEALSMHTADFKEAVNAFVDKRKPEFKGY